MPDGGVNNIGVAALTTAVQAMSGWENANQVEARRLLFLNLVISVFLSCIPQVQTYYLAGVNNEAADQLSRWREKGLWGFDPQKGVSVDVSFVLDVLARPHVRPDHV